MLAVGTAWERGYTMGTFCCEALQDCYRAGQYPAKMFHMLLHNVHTQNKLHTTFEPTFYTTI